MAKHQHAVANKDIERAEQAATPAPDKMSWAQMEGPTTTRSEPAILTPEQDAIAKLQEAANDAQREEFLELNQGQFLGNTRQILQDPLTRILNCTSYIGRPEKMWERDYKGNPRAVIFDREYPQRKILVDDYTYEPDDKTIAERTNLCARHGYLYIYGTPRFVLNQVRLEELLDASRKVMSDIVRSMKKEATKRSAVSDDE